MATSLRRELAYDASADAVAAMLGDAAFREEVLARQRVVRGSVSIEGERVRIEQVWSGTNLPGFARKVAGDEIVIVQEEHWVDPASADVRVTIPGKPGDMTGTFRLTQSGDTTAKVVDLSIKVGIPLVAGKIEKLIADMLGKALDKEHQVGREWLAR